MTTTLLLVGWGVWGFVLGMLVITLAVRWWDHLLAAQDAAVGPPPPTLEVPDDPDDWEIADLYHRIDRLSRRDCEMEIRDEMMERARYGEID